MLMIRLSRYGKKKQPTYRMIVSEKKKDPWGDCLEVVGTFNPRTNPATITLQKERIAYWIAKGAQLSDTVHNMLVNEKMVDAKKRRVVAVTKKQSAEAKPAEAPAAAPAAEAPKA